jgi:heat shock protein beta
MRNKLILLCLVALIIFPIFFTFCLGEKEHSGKGSTDSVEKPLKSESIPSKTDDEVVEREEDTIVDDGYSVHDLKLMKDQAEKHKFQAEVSSVMDIIIDSLYSNKEVFLREAISNASDALDKIRFMSLTDRKQMETNDKLEIRIKSDKEKKLLYISDTGIGMTKNELVTNLGTIAKSGTKVFLEQIKASQDNNMLIGQFGVGFYSVFLVADKVTVISKHNNDTQSVWQCDTRGEFYVSEDPRGNTLGRGTQLVLQMKEDAWDFLEEDTLRGLVKKYSEFITFPIYLYTSHEEEKEVPMTPEEIKEEEEKEGKDTKKEEEEEKVSLDEEKEEQEEQKEEKEEAEKPVRTKKVKETIWEWELMNQTKPLWVRNPKEITEEEYNSFYKSFTKDWQDPLDRSHFLAEGEVEFKSLLYIPQTAPLAMFDPNNPDAHKSIKLYVKRVFITDDFKDILPKYLSFIKGLVDSDDLPLNVSREMLQEHKILKIIKRKLVRKAIAMIQALASGKEEEEGEEAPAEEEEKDEKKDTAPNEKYRKFWKEFGANIKLGIIEDSTNRSRLAKLLIFHSSKTDDYTFLSDYVSRVKPNQKQIYYLAGESKDVLEHSPLLEKLEKKGYEVLFLTDPIDEYAMQSLDKFDGKWKLTNIAKEGLHFDEDDEEEDKKKDTEEFSPLTDYLKKVLSSKIEKCVISNRLVHSPSALVATTYGHTANMERILKTQTLALQKNIMHSKKILEINPDHPIVIELNKRIQVNVEDPVAKDIAGLMYETAALSSGFSLDDPAGFADRINRMLGKSLGVENETSSETNKATENSKEKEEL